MINKTKWKISHVLYFCKAIPEQNRMHVSESQNPDETFGEDLRALQTKPSELKEFKYPYHCQPLSLALFKTLELRT